MTLAACVAQASMITPSRLYRTRNCRSLFSQEIVSPPSDRGPGCGIDQGGAARGRGGPWTGGR